MSALPPKADIAPCPHHWLTLGYGRTPRGQQNSNSQTQGVADPAPHLAANFQTFTSQRPQQLSCCSPLNETSGCDYESNSETPGGPPVRNTRATRCKKCPWIGRNYNDERIGDPHVS